MKLESYSGVWDPRPRDLRRGGGGGGRNDGGVQMAWRPLLECVRWVCLPPATPPRTALRVSPEATETHGCLSHLSSAARWTGALAGSWVPVLPAQVQRGGWHPSTPGFNQYP